ncbi:MAG TPA: chorismate synthase [Clostridiales bacterium]|nr:chorismate synthase [Clostridiales bacterium]
MSSVYGETLKVSLFGQSHSEFIGVVIDGMPSGFKVDIPRLQRFMLRRAARSALSTKRQEPDVPEFLSGLTDGVTCGAPICAVIRNTNVKSGDYDSLRCIPRPSHADYAAMCKHGKAADLRGGGHLSGRITAALCVAGGICLQYLENAGISIGAHIYSLAGIKDTPFNPVSVSAKDFLSIAEKDFPVIIDSASDKMMSRIMQAREAKDSIGGIIEFAVTGLKPGLGAPHFGGLENRISAAVFGIPAVKGIEFGNGFACADMTGSENNDAFYIGDDGVYTATNNSGGINGGMSNGMPLIGRAAIKPTPSVSQEQDSVNMETGKNTSITISGRHDPCIVHRAVPCLEAAVAIAITDTILTDKRG